MARPRLAPDPPGWSFPAISSRPPESPRCTPSQAGQREAPLGRPVSQHGEGRDRTEGLSAAAAACVGTNFLAPPPSWRQQLRPDKEEGRGRPGSSFSLAVPHFEADSGNLAPPSPGEDGPPVPTGSGQAGWGWGGGKPLRAIHSPSSHNRKQGFRRSGGSMVAALGRGS